MKFPLGIQTFADIRNGGYVYVDKTQHVFDLITTGKHYFLSRPRRFGKSLFLSTIEAVFRGEKALFDGLAITKTDYDFATHPVVFFEFTNVLTRQASDVERYIINNTNRTAKKYDVELTLESYEERLSELIEALYDKTGKQVVFLVDEYDKPILDNLFEDELKQVRSVLAGFYAVLKQSDKFLKFVFITGVSKFAKLSVFSGMNSLTDISMDRSYATLVGVTQQELEDNFAGPIEKIAQVEQLERNELLAKVKHWYNGYYFEENAQGVYNPYSLLSYFRTQKFKNYWFETATPTFLLDLLQKRQFELKNLIEDPVGEGAFGACEPENMGVQSMFLQTGYLTIKSYEDGIYQLGFPNFEVKKSFYDSVAARYSKLDSGIEQSYTAKLIRQLKAQEFDDFFETLSVFFANIPYDISIAHEKYYQSLFFAIFKLIGLSIEAEVKTNKGRIDCVIETEQMFCVIEFKLIGSKEEALQQIKSKDYSQKYHLDGKQIVMIGVEFDQQGRNIGSYLIES